MMSFHIICVIVGLAALCDVSLGQQSSDEARLFQFLQGRYKSEFRYTRPVVHADDNVTVGIGVSLVDVQDFDTLTGFGTFYSYDKMTWVDQHLKWEPRQFGGLDKIRIPSDMIWTPDIVLYNSQDMVPERFESMAVVSSTGDVLWVPRSKYHIRCYEPEDGAAEWQCNLKFGSWTYSGDLLDPVLYAGMNQTDVKDFFANHHWEVVENTAEKVVKFYDCCKEPYPQVTFSLKLNYRGPTNAASQQHVMSAFSVLAILLMRLFI